MYTQGIKIIVDFLTALLVLVVISPIFFLLTLLLIIANSGKPFFLQKRPGKDERIFTIIKFRTMNNKRGKDGKLLPDAERLTGIGQFIRSTSMDELPQLLNVLKGDMSFVGPRPLMPEYLPLYNAEQKQRHDVKPGITGYAQVHGRNTVSWEEKFEMDIYYVKKVSFALDCKILLKTFQKVFLRSDINSEGSATTEAFTGTNSE